MDLIECIQTAFCMPVRKVQLIKEDETSFSKRSDWQLAKYVTVACVKLWKLSEAGAANVNVTREDHPLFVNVWRVMRK